MNPLSRSAPTTIAARRCKTVGGKRPRRVAHLALALSLGAALVAPAAGVGSTLHPTSADAGEMTLSSGLDRADAVPRSRVFFNYSHSQADDHRDIFYSHATTYFFGEPSD